MWIPRKLEIIICPRCKSPYWNKDRKTEDDSKKTD